MNTIVRGRPARYAVRLRCKARMRIASGAAVAGAAVPAVLWGPEPAGQIAALLLLAAGGSLVQDGRKRNGQTGAGIRSERTVARILARAGLSAVVHGADLGRGGDADHVVLGPCVAVVETKTGRGQLQIRSGRIHAGRRELWGDPVAQVNRQAAGLRRMTGHPAEAVVCVAGASGAPVRIGGVVVCSAQDLSSVLAGMPRRISGREARTMAEGIPLAD